MYYLIKEVREMAKGQPLISSSVDLERGKAYSRVGYAFIKMSDAELKKLLWEIGHSISAKLKPEDVASPGTREGISGWANWQKTVSVVGGVLAILAIGYGALHFVIASELKAAFEQPTKTLQR